MTQKALQQTDTVTARLYIYNRHPNTDGYDIINVSCQSTVRSLTNMALQHDVMIATPVIACDDEGYAISDGVQYEHLTVNESRRVWSEYLGLYLESVDGKLRF